MMLPLRWLTLIVFFPLLCSAQNRVDSLKIVVNEHLRNQRIDSAAYGLSQIAHHFNELKEYDSALRYYYQVLSYQREISKPWILAWSYNGIGACYSSKGYPDSTMFYYSQAIDLYREVQDTVQVAYVVNNLSIFYKNQGLYVEAIDLAIQVLSLLENRPPDRTVASIYNTIGACYRSTGEFSRAMIYLKKALAIRQTLGINSVIAGSHNNIGEVYLHMKQYDSALHHFTVSLELKKLEATKNSWSSTLNNLGAVYLERGEFLKAESYFKESLAINNEYNNSNGEVQALNYLAESRFSLKDFANAEKYLLRSEAIVRRMGDLKSLQRTLELYQQVYKAKGDYAKAIRYSEEMKIITDSLYTIEKFQALANLEFRFQSEKKEKEISLLKEKEKVSLSEIQSKNFAIQMFILALVLTAVIIALGGYNFMVVRKGKVRVETLLKELHHRVKNNLQILSSLLAIQSQELTDEKAKQAVQTSEGRVNAMALIHKKLYSIDVSQAINMHEYISELVQYLAQSYGYAQKGVRINLDVDPLSINVDKAIPLGLIINEIVSNAFKHAYVDHDHPELNITLKTEQKMLVLVIRDNGLVSNFNAIENSKSYGLKIVKSMTKDLRGKTTITNGQGTCFELKIPG